MPLIDIYKKVFELIPEGVDIIPNNFDFVNNNYAIEVKVAENINGTKIEDDITLQIRVCGVSENKGAIITKAMEIDQLLNDSEFDRCWVVRENPYLTGYSDADKWNSVLQYIIKKY